MVFFLYICFSILKSAHRGQAGYKSFGKFLAPKNVINGTKYALLRRGLIEKLADS